MKAVYILIFVLTIFGCKKDQVDEPVPTKPEPLLTPKINIIRGNNQVGFASNYLSDSIVFEVIPHRVEDIEKFSYKFSTSHPPLTLFNQSVIRDGKWYISVAWKLGNKYEKQDLTFYLTEKCQNFTFTDTCRKLDSVKVSVPVKQPWIKIFNGDPWELYDMHFSGSNSGIAVGDLPFTPGYLKTEDGGNTWSYQAHRRNDIYQLSFSGADTGIAILTNNWAMFTYDGGKTFFMPDWSPPFVGHQSSSDYFMYSEREILSISRSGGIARSENTGKSWTAYGGFTFRTALNDITCMGDTCYACGAIGKVIVSHDRGRTWVERELLLNNDLKVITFVDDKLGFAAGTLGSLIRTSDGGNNWQPITTGMRFTIIGIHFSSTLSGYIVSSAGEIARTIDGGRSWTLINKDSYGVFQLNKVLFRGNTILGLQVGSIFKYVINND